jgi:hypothetical protein
VAQVVDGTQAAVAVQVDIGQILVLQLADHLLAPLVQVAQVQPWAQVLMELHLHFQPFQQPMAAVAQVISDQIMHLQKQVDQAAQVHRTMAIFQALYMVRRVT